MARAVDREGRWSGLAGLLPPAQPLGCSSATSPCPRVLPEDLAGLGRSTLLSLQYYGADLRRQGSRTFLLGPGHLHPMRSCEARAKAKEYTDARLMTEAADFPAGSRLRYQARSIGTA